MKGNVVWYNQSKGYGFIKHLEDLVFLHHTAFKNKEKTNTGDELEFDVVKGEKGLKAINVFKSKGEL